MKFVSCQDLSMFNCLLDSYDCGTFIIDGKLEAYHCKRTAQDKKLSKEVEESIRMKKEQQQQQNTFGSITTISTSIPSPSSSPFTMSSNNNNNNKNNSSHFLQPSTFSVQSTRTRAVSAPNYYHHKSSSTTTTTTNSTITHQPLLRYQPFDEFDPEITNDDDDDNDNDDDTMDDDLTTDSVNGIPIIKSNDYIRNVESANFLSPALSPPCPHDLSVPLNPFDDTKSDTQKFIDLISLLNLSYPDYDFSGINQEDFSRETYKERLINSINLSLRDALTPDQLNQLWRAIDSIVSIHDSEIYTYNPDRNQDDPTGDPLALTNGKVWVWNYFFYNKKLRRCLFFTCCAKNKNSMYHSYSGDDEVDFDMSDEEHDDDDDIYEGSSKNVHVHMAPRHRSYYDDHDSYHHHDDDEDMYFDDL